MQRLLLAYEFSRVGNLTESERGVKKYSWNDLPRSGNRTAGVKLIRGSIRVSRVDWISKRGGWPVNRVRKPSGSLRTSISGDDKRRSPDRRPFENGNNEHGLFVHTLLSAFFFFSFLLILRAPPTRHQTLANSVLIYAPRARNMHH